MTTDIEDALLTFLRAWPGLSGIKTFEADLRECVFTGDKLTEGFRESELPALNLSTSIGPVASLPFSSGEVQYTIPLTVVCVARSQRKKDAQTQALALQDEVERAVNTLRKSGNALGPNILVTGAVTSNAPAVIEGKPYSFALSSTEAHILAVVPIG